jgi:hypothetical protein
MLQAPEEFFSIYLLLLAALGPGVHLASNKNEYQKQEQIFLGSRTLPVLKANNLTVFFEPIF